MFATLMTALLAAGMAQVDPPVDDEAPCNTHRPQQKAVIVVSRGEDGKPVADPEACTVRPGARIVWQAAADSGFEVVFRGATPDQNGRRRLGSNPDGPHQRIDISARRPDRKQAYHYDVVIAGEALDPVVIIDPLH